MKSDAVCLFLANILLIFSGSLRRNLDVLNNFQYFDLGQVLENVQLKDFVENLDRQIEYELMENGANVSVGESGNLFV